MSEKRSKTPVPSGITRLPQREDLASGRKYSQWQIVRYEIPIGNVQCGFLSLLPINHGLKTEIIMEVGRDLRYGVERKLKFK